MRERAWQSGTLAESSSPRRKRNQGKPIAGERRLLNGIGIGSELWQAQFPHEGFTVDGDGVDHRDF